MYVAPLKATEVNTCGRGGDGNVVTGSSVPWIANFLKLDVPMFVRLDSRVNY
jgi:hypothetical protein